ncbi:MAG: efflux RND transporter periplasmic adaptor subunit [Minisyncoccota bacterium]
MNFLSKSKLLILSHKLISVITLLVLGFAGYYFLSSSNAVQTSYVLSTVTKGNIISSVDGSGQVASLNEVDIKSKVSGDITWVGVVAGQEVKNGQALISIDSTDARKAIATAETSLAEAKLQYDKDLAQAPIDYQKKLETLQSEKNDLEKTYEDVFNSFSNAFLDLPTTIAGIEDVLYGDELSITKSWNINYYKDFFGKGDDKDYAVLVDIAEADYKIARSDYDKNFLDFTNANRYADKTTKENLLSETINTTKAIAQAIKSEQNVLDTIVDVAQGRKETVPSTISTFQTKLKSYIGTINGHLTSLLSQQSSLENTKQQIINTQRDIDLLLINNPTGNDPITLQISKNSIAKKEADLADLKADLANYTIRAPFDGTIAKVNIKKFDSISSGTSLLTIVTKQQLATVSLNEIDVAGIKVGQKVSLSFDAVEGLAMTGQVSEVDTIGTVSQGVVNYSIKIVFDTQDVRVKSGMSVNASIITDTKIDVLIVPSSAIKSSGGISYVEIPDPSEVIGQIGNSGVVLVKPVNKQEVEIGVTNGTNTEIIGGLKEGDKIILRTISGSSTQTTSSMQKSNSIRVPGMGF